jgi:hypothetical protein
MKEQ